MNVINPVTTEMEEDRWYSVPDGETSQILHIPKPHDQP